MRTLTIQARNAQEAVARIRATLGPEAVVLQVRKVRLPGWAGWLGRPGIEVVAALPEAEPAEQTRQALEQLKQELAGLRALVEKQPYPPAGAPAPGPDTREDLPEPGELAAFLLRMGLLPAYARRLAASAPRTAGGLNRQECAALLRALLEKQWRDPPPLQRDALHVLVGAPGVGKTTALCQWLARLVLRENQPARVWYADGDRPNLCEGLRLQAELLGVPLRRLGGEAEELKEARGRGWHFLDLPGMAWRNRAALEKLQRRAEAWGPVQWHLVVSAAYDTALMLHQAQAFSALPLAGVIVTHVDEQPALGRVWNLLCGTNCSVRFLAGGQNIPGEFSPASPMALGPAILWAEPAWGGAPAASGGAGKPSAMQCVAD